MTATLLLLESRTAMNRKVEGENPRAIDAAKFVSRPLAVHDYGADLVLSRQTRSIRRRAAHRKSLAKSYAAYLSDSLDRQRPKFASSDPALLDRLSKPKAAARAPWLACCPADNDRSA